MAEPTELKSPKKDKPKKVADPVAATIDVATQQMILRAQELGVETIFDRAVTMKPCNIGIQGTCCKNCAMGPCRLPLPKSGIEGEDERKGICGATANTIAARNFIRMIAGGAAAHSDHGRCVAEVFLSAARKETEAYKIKDVNKLLAIAPHFGVATTVDVDGETQDREVDEIALEEALRIREAGQADEVIVVSIGGNECQQQLRTGLAMGADRAIRKPFKNEEILAAVKELAGE